MLWIVLIAGLALLWVFFRRYGPAPKGVLIAGLALVVVLLLLFSSRPPQSEMETGTWIAKDGRQTIDTSGTFTTLDGKQVSLSDLGEGPMFLNVWATWCGPCRMEMPAMAELYREYQPKGLRMVAVTDEDRSTVLAHLRENPYPFTILLDPERTLSDRFGIKAIPTTFIVDGQGKLVYRHVGYNQWNSPQVKQQISALLN